MSIDDIKADIKAIVAEKNCGPIFIRLSWHDAGVYSTGKLTGGKELMIKEKVIMQERIFFMCRCTN